MKGNEYQRQNVPDPESWRPTPNRFKIPPVHVSTQEVRHNPRWDKKMKHIRGEIRQGRL